MPLPAILGAIVGSSIFKSVLVGAGLSLASRLFRDRRQQDRIITDRTPEDTRTSRLRTGVGPAQWVLGAAKTPGVVTWGVVKGNLLHMAITLSEGDIEAVDSIFIDDEEIQLTQTPGTYELVPVANTGNSPRFRLFTYQHDADPDKGKTLREVDPKFTARHVGRGVSWVHLQLDGAFFEQLPKIEFLVRGIKIRWPGQTFSRWTDSASALRYWWLTVRRGVGPDSIDRESVLRANDICGEILQYTLPHPYNLHYSGYSTRYAINGVLNSTDSPDVVENEMDFAWFGHISNDNGVLSFHPGADREPKWIISTDDIVSLESMVTGSAARDRVTGVRSSISNLRENGYAPASMEIIDPSAYERYGKRVKDLGTRKFVTDGLALGRISDLALQEELLPGKWTYILRSGNDLQNLKIKSDDGMVISDPHNGLTGQKLIVLSAEVTQELTVRVTVQEDIDWSIKFISPPEVMETTTDTSEQAPRTPPSDDFSDNYDSYDEEYIP